MRAKEIFFFTFFLKKIEINIKQLNTYINCKVLKFNDN